MVQFYLVLISTPLDVLGLDILGLDILGLDILGRFRFPLYYVPSNETPVCGNRFRPGGSKIELVRPST